MPTDHRWRRMRPYLRILFIMVMSFIVVIIGTLAVVDPETPLGEKDGIFAALRLDGRRDDTAGEAHEKQMKQTRETRCA